MDQEKSRSLKTLIIHIYGIVQGVGFRPFIAKLADRYAITGEVCNDGGYVTVIASGLTENLRLFIDKIVHEKPEQSQVIHIETKEVPYNSFQAFTILESKESKEDLVMLPPDISICRDCIKELEDQGNKRFAHSFISCTACGPRYSIIDSVPYDRCNTTMNVFEMCPDCNKEYRDRKDRRYHAQTISCKKCGPYLIYLGLDEGKEEETINEEAFIKALKAIKAGKVVAVKGIGGYHLCCSPFDKGAVRKLRNIKRREEKPFAVMFGGIEEIKKYCEVTKEDERLLALSSAPIVLMKRKHSRICENVFQESRMLGAFVPYTPLHYRLVKKTGPLVMTSANISGSPIIKDETMMLDCFGKTIGGMLYHTRDIKVGLDDSVTKTIGGKVQMIRRARGYVPLPIYYYQGDLKSKRTVFATGGQLKASFCLAKGLFAYPSQHLGDLDEEASIKVYKESYMHMKGLLQIEPEIAVCDLHPNYFTTAFAKELNIPYIQVQHHHAHIASVMAEHGLEEVIGVAFDGTGYGEDGAIWGGEFLLCHKDSYERKGHLSYVTLLSGDESMKDVRKTATCYLIAGDYKDRVLDERGEIIEAAILNKINTHSSSSMGRLLDALSCILGICDYNDYEGKAAIMLENYAYRGQEQGIKPVKLSFFLYEEGGQILIDQIAFIKEVMKNSINKSENEICGIALGIHLAISEMILEVVHKISLECGVKNVALSGGVFQNTLLLKNTSELLLRQGFNVYINEEVPPNDGGISLGQVYIGMEKLVRGD